MRHWFIGDGVITRYGVEDGEKVRVRAVGGGPEGQRRYRCELVHRQDVLKFTEWHSLDAALRQGEEWIPAV